MLMQFTNISKNTILHALKSTASNNHDYHNDPSQERPVSSAMVQHPSLADFMVFAGEVAKGRKKRNYKEVILSLIVTNHTHLLFLKVSVRATAQTLELL